MITPYTYHGDSPLVRVRMCRQPITGKRCRWLLGRQMRSNERVRVTRSSNLKSAYLKIRSGPNKIDLPLPYVQWLMDCGPYFSEWDRHSCTCLWHFWIMCPHDRGDSFPTSRLAKLKYAHPCYTYIYIYIYGRICLPGAGLEIPKHAIMCTLFR